MKKNLLCILGGVILVVVVIALVNFCVSQEASDEYIFIIPDHVYITVSKIEISKDETDWYPVETEEMDPIDLMEGITTSVSAPSGNYSFMRTEIKSYTVNYNGYSKDLVDSIPKDYITLITEAGDVSPFEIFGEASTSLKISFDFENCIQYNPFNHDFKIVTAPTVSISRLN